MQSPLLDSRSFVSSTFAYPNNYHAIYSGARRTYLLCYNYYITLLSAFLQPVYWSKVPRIKKPRDKKKGVVAFTSVALSQCNLGNGPKKRHSQAYWCGQFDFSCNFRQRFFFFISVCYSTDQICCCCISHRQRQAVTVAGPFTKATNLFSNILTLF